MPPGDDGALADGIERILNDSELQRRLGEEARRRIVDHFSWRETAVRTMALYEEVRSMASRRRAD